MDRVCNICKTKKPHMAKGLCKSCYLKQYREDPKNHSRISQQKRDWWKANMGFSRQYAKRNREYFDGQRDTVLERDKYSCVLCGSTSRLTVHHKDGNGRSSTNTDNDIGNLTTVCRKCHLDLHREEMNTHRKLRKNGYWSKSYSKCTCCGTTRKPHNSGGLCQTCYMRTRRSQMR